MTPTTAGPVDALVDAVLGVPGVVGLHAGALGEVATYLPGRRVPGVRVRDGVVDVHVVLAEGAPLRTTAVAVRAAVATLVPGAAVDVTVEDVRAPGVAAPPGRRPS
ncbi:Asp23/Gls24 family envelope stress response protein [Lapillicoccus jejuensis]|uniref:Asp23/Gls24 family envelope stress response protein n=1 Tax=Lapillicoccus jejuensis TaxID=402171 RepID=A0A542DY04_9MICO|nr:Asp23/Gls24 family envelope stress response protein [Lapillicoccus jejuensis]TQJ07955.1 hypothetical protein FB458_1027 [Lapillicoccus jejuensis]